MPYIPEFWREELKNRKRSIEGPGELNYAITQLLVGYIATKGLRYSTINDILGALDGASKEFYRRVAAPYEDTKCAEHGDVYPGPAR